MQLFLKKEEECFFISSYNIEKYANKRDPMDDMEVQPNEFSK